MWSGQRENRTKALANWNEPGGYAMNPLLNDDKNEEYSVQTKYPQQWKRGERPTKRQAGRKKIHKNNENRQHHNYRMQFQTQAPGMIYTLHILKMDNIQRVFFCSSILVAVITAAVAVVVAGHCVEWLAVSHLSGAFIF